MAATVYTTPDIAAPHVAQEHFAEQYDLDSPMDAINNYARLMHSHTKAQLDLATRLSQRRRPNRDSQDKDAPVPSVAGASSRDSTASSIDSRAS